MDTILTRIRRESNGVTEDLTGPIKPMTSLEKATAAAQKRIAERRAEREAIFQEAMQLPVEGEPLGLNQVRAGEVSFDPRYQTADRYDDARARRIAMTFDWNECKPISINIRPGHDARRWCYDGQHRVRAVLYRLGPEAMIPATFTNVPYELEARLFAEQHDGEKRVSKSLRHGALVEAGDVDALARDALLTRFGLRLGHRAARNTIAATPYHDCYTRYGPEVTALALQLLIERWNGSGDSLEAHIVKGFALFLAKRGDHPNFKLREMAKVVTRLELSDLEVTGRGYSGLSRPQQIAAALSDEYNWKRTSNRVPDWHPTRGE